MVYVTARAASIGEFPTVHASQGAPDGHGNAYVAGYTGSTDAFPTRSALQVRDAGSYDAFPQDRGNRSPGVREDRFGGARFITGGVRPTRPPIGEWGS